MDGLSSEGSDLLLINPPSTFEELTHYKKGDTKCGQWVGRKAFINTTQVSWKRFGT